jgi:hypothetical protein
MICEFFKKGNFERAKNIAYQFQHESRDLKIVELMISVALKNSENSVKILEFLRSEMVAKTPETLQ